MRKKVFSLKISIIHFCFLLICLPIQKLTCDSQRSHHNLHSNLIYIIIREMINCPFKLMRIFIFQFYWVIIFFRSFGNFYCNSLRLFCGELRRDDAGSAQVKRASDLFLLSSHSTTCWAFLHTLMHKDGKISHLSLVHAFIQRAGISMQIVMREKKWRGRAGEREKCETSTWFNANSETLFLSLTHSLIKLSSYSFKWDILDLSEWKFVTHTFVAITIVSK